MNLKELALPVRIYWDVIPVADHSAINYAGACEEILEMKVFTLNVRDTGLELSSACVEILDRLKNGNIAVALDVSQSALNPSAISYLSELKVNELLVRVSAKDDFRSLAEVLRQCEDKKIMSGISFSVDGNNYGYIPDIISFCLNKGITRLVFPMQRLEGAADCFYVTGEEGRTLGLRLNEISIDKMNLTIHDPFLWKIFYPASTFPAGGCQAANSMAYISSDGSVYPCPSMPLALGNLRQMPLKRILSSVHKKGLAKSLLNPPEECFGCKEFNRCMGGCRGRAYVVAGSFNARDPACG